MWNKYWGYIYAQGTAPVWVGEFGTDNTSTDIESSAAGSQGQWFQSLVSYIKSNPGDGLEHLGPQRRGRLRPAGQRL